MAVQTMVKCKTECPLNHHVLSCMAQLLNKMRLANKERLLLYFKTGKMLSEKIESEKWGQE